MSNLTLRTILVTGANGRIGTQICIQLASQKGQQQQFLNRVICVCRNQEKASKLIQQIKQTSGNQNIEYLLCDVSRQIDIRRAAKEWGSGQKNCQNPHIFALINNAAITNEVQQFTKEGYDLQFATNVLSYHWMVLEFLQYMKGPNATVAAAQPLPSRIVNVASFYAGGFDFSNPELKLNGTYDVDQMYRATKEANRLMSQAWAEKLLESDDQANSVNSVSVNSVHPGICTSNVSLGLGFDLDRSDAGAAKCAEGPVYLASSMDEQVLASNGKYWDSVKLRGNCEFCKDRKKVNSILELLNRYCV